MPNIITSIYFAYYSYIKMNAKHLNQNKKSKLKTCHKEKRKKGNNEKDFKRMRKNGQQITKSEERRYTK